MTACTEREAGLRADLDLSHRDRASMKSDLDRVRGDLEAGRSIWGAEKNRLQEDLEAARGRIADLETQISVLTEQKERLELEKREKLEEISRTYEGLLEGMKEEVEKGRVTISQLRGKLSVNLLDEILFDSGSTVIKPEGRDVLKRLGELLGNAADKAIVIEGHTDDVPISGELARRFPTNWELSTARAGSVVRYLQESAGIEPERLSAVGFGPYRPVASNDTVDGRARNRRIEVKLVPLEAPLFTPSQTRPEDTEPASEETAGD